MIEISFHQEVIDLPLDRLIALKDLSTRTRGTRKYKQVRASLKHIGLIEPLAVFRNAADKFLVTNGNLRLHILRDLNVASARCVVALDEEAYTYNKRVNPLSPITEHFMILKAVENGVTEERIALGLDIDVRGIRARRNLLDGICPEAIELLKDKRVSTRTFVHLRKMKPVRQIEAAELMVAGKNYSTAFAASILAVTRADLRVKPEKPRMATNSAVLEETNGNLGADLIRARRTFGENMLSLGVISRSIETLLQNAKVDRYLKKNHADVLKEIQEVLGLVNQERAQPASVEAPAARAKRAS